MCVCDSVYLNSRCITGPTTVGALPKLKVLTHTKTRAYIKPFVAHGCRIWDKCGSRMQIAILEIQ